MKNFVSKNQIWLKRFCMMTLDLCFIILAPIIALLIRFEFNVTADFKNYIDVVWSYLPWNIVCTLFLFYIFRLYHSIWTFASILELERIISACVISGILFYVLGYQILGFKLPRSVFFLYTFLLITFICTVRFSYRALRLAKHKHTNRTNVTNLMLIGAGDAASMIIKEIISSSYIHKNVCCVIDDASSKIGQYIHGIKVVGNRAAILDNINKYGIDEIIIAIPSAPKAEISAIVDICKDTDCTLKILPGIYELVNGQASISQLRDVDVEDLLGRDPISVDLNSIMGYVAGKTILVTGGGGSIGSELCRQLASHGAGKLIIVDIYENNAYAIQQELSKQFPELDLVVLIASVRNTLRIQKIFQDYKPDIVYHAAAHKHVPLMETSPNEAVKNNVFGTLKTVRAASAAGVEKFVLISSDKAVNPTNIMGATKRICEMIVQTYDKRSNTSFVAVRFGNVLGSNGSVIPLFKQQIAAGGPVTVTHPDIIRYFMTISEAVSLVLQAGAYANGGEIFILDMGQPVRILDLAKNLIRLSGYIPDEEISIEFTGLRPGEKLYEELLMDEEGLQDTDNKLIHIGKPIEMNEEVFLKQLDRLYEIVLDEPGNIRTYIKEIVKTYFTSM